jgi:predicted transcriptional regulator of viral defense system
MRLKIVRASGPSLTEGVETHDIDGVSVPITSPAKTVVDCFKYRRRVGLDVALEALQDFMKDSAHGRQRDALWRYAEIDRVQTVIRPYLEALS